VANAYSKLLDAYDIKDLEAMFEDDEPVELPSEQESKSTEEEIVEEPEQPVERITRKPDTTGCC